MPRATPAAASEVYGLPDLQLVRQERSRCAALSTPAVLSCHTPPVALGGAIIADAVADPRTCLLHGARRRWLVGPRRTAAAAAAAVAGLISLLFLLPPHVCVLARCEMARVATLYAADGQARVVSTPRGSPITSASSAIIRGAHRRLPPLSSKKQLRVGAARWLCSEHRPEGSVWLGSYARVLLTSVTCADLPPPTSISDQTGRGRRAKLLRTRQWPAVMTPRDGELRADDVAASRRAADGAGPSIEAARTCAHGDRRGAVAGFAACRTTSHIISGGERQSHRPLLFPSKFFHYLVLWSSSPAASFIYANFRGRRF